MHLLYFQVKYFYSILSFDQIVVILRHIDIIHMITAASGYFYVTDLRTNTVFNTSAYNFFSVEILFLETGYSCRHIFTPQHRVMLLILCREWWSMTTSGLKEDQVGRVPGHGCKKIVFSFQLKMHGLRFLIFFCDFNRKLNYKFVWNSELFPNPGISLRSKGDAIELPPQLVLNHDKNSTTFLILVSIRCSPSAA